MKRSTVYPKPHIKKLQLISSLKHAWRHKTANMIASTEISYVLMTLLRKNGLPWIVLIGIYEVWKDKDGLSRIFTCLVITAFYENRITWDEERLEEIAALLEVVGEKICRLLIFWGMWKFCHICVCTSNTHRHKAAQWKSSAPGPAPGYHGDEKKFSVKLNWCEHGGH